MKSALLTLLALLVVSVILPATGCAGKSDGKLSSAVVRAVGRDKADRLGRIAARSGGDWSRVPKADRDFVMAEFTSGSEIGAKILVKNQAAADAGGTSGERPAGK